MAGNAWLSITIHKGRAPLVLILQRVFGLRDMRLDAALVGILIMQSASVGISDNRIPGGGDIFAYASCGIAGAQQSGRTGWQEQVKNEDSQSFAHRQLHRFWARLVDVGRERKTTGSETTHSTFHRCISYFYPGDHRQEMVK
jgi:hypothetical protein